MVAPEPDFTYRPPSTAAPFALGYLERYPLRRLADDLGARLVPNALARVSSERHEIVTTSGEVVPYDRLVLAVGARPYPAFQHAITLGSEDATEALTTLVSDLERGHVRRVAFVVPSGSSWTLPLYELAIMTARHGWAIGIDGAQYWFVTPEPEPLAIFGARAGRAVHGMLEPEGITFIGSARAEVRQGTVLLDRRAGAHRGRPDRMPAAARWAEDSRRPDRQRRVHSRRRRRRRVRCSRRLRGGRRDHLPDQAGRPRLPAGRRGRRVDRRGGRRPRRAPPLSARAPRQAHDRRPRSLPAPQTRRGSERRRGFPAAAVVAADARSQGAISPHISSTPTSAR